MDHHRAHRGALGGGRAVLGSAPAPDRGLVAGQRRHRISAALLGGARIVVAHGGRQRIESGVEHRGVGGLQVGPDPGHSRAGLPGLDVAVVFDFRRYPHRVGIEFGHPQVDTVAQLGRREPHPFHTMPGDRSIQLRHAVGFDVLGAADDHLDHPVIDHPGGEHRRDCGQIITQHPRHMDLVPRPPPADVLRRRHLGGHLLERIGTPQPALHQLHRPQPIQMPDGGQPLGRGRRLRTPRVTDLIDP
jgi:hypothetical protein